MTPHTLAPVRRVGLSYWRYSKDKQGKGDSEARQDRAFRCFCERHHLTPLVSDYGDRGRSGYKDEHRKKGKLGKLIADAKAGAFEPGTVIVVEAWDRLGRLIPNKQVNLIEELLELGLAIGVCQLDDVFTYEDFGTHKWTTLAVFVQLAYQESKQKGERVAGSWVKRRELARDEGTLMTDRLPAWLRLGADGKAEAVPERALILSRVFGLAAAGMGEPRLIGLLTRDAVPPFGGSGKWTSTYLSNLLTDRRVLGEFQPRRTDRTPSGPVILDYYPRVITDEQFALVQVARAAHTQGGGRSRRGTRDRKYVNVFRSLVKSAGDGDVFAAHNVGTAAATRLVLANTAGLIGSAPTTTMPYAHFEEAILSLLAEVKAGDVVPAGPAAGNATTADALREELKQIRASLAGLKGDLQRGYDRHLADLLRACGAEEERVARLLLEETARTARPAEKAWGELPSLVAMIRDRGDEARLLIRGVLLAAVSEIRVLLVRRGAAGGPRKRNGRVPPKSKGGKLLVAAQVFFVGGIVRSYLILSRSAARHVEARWWAWSFADAVQADDFDLRDPADVGNVVAVLEQLDLQTLTEGKTLQ